MRLTVNRLVKFGEHLKELRLHLCPHSAESTGAKEFVLKHYVNVKRDNPTLPILIRECDGVQPRLWARYEYGKEKSVTLTNLGADDVLKQVEAYGKAQF